MRRSRASRIRVGLAGLVAALVVAAGCGVPTDDAPRALSVDNVPFGLLTTAPTTTSTTVPPSQRARVRIFLVGADAQLVRLAEVVRPVARPVNPARVLAALFAGPTPEEQEQGLRTALPPDARLLSVSELIDPGLIVVNISAALREVTGAQLRLAVAQIVYTATALPRVSRVQLEIEGEPVQVPLEDGSVVSELAPSDFPTLDPGYMPPTTTTTEPVAEPGPGTP